jgi:hypothetical protein
MGIHCIFGLRRRNIEFEENGFFVHLDRANKIVMVVAVYQPPFEIRDEPTSQPEDLAILKAQEIANSLIKKINQFEPIDVMKTSYDGWVWILDRLDNCYVLGNKIKLATPQGSYTVLADQRGNTTYFKTDAHDGPESFQLSNILGSAWARPSSNPANDEDPIQPEVKKILLRGVSANDGQLSGRYVSVQDWLTRTWPTITNPVLGDESSHLDRIMAFYHIDKMQRYFRHLGLLALDTYSHLNPLRVVLADQERSAYISTEQCIYIGRLNRASDHAWTHARNSRTLYHECLHAITDALARLHRQDLDSAQSRQAFELFQAAAMDEALADYFSCTIVAQEGDSIAAYRRLRGDPDGNVEWSRKLADRRQLDAGSLDLSIVDHHQKPEGDQQEKLPVEIIYDWCQHWARYLWLLRKQIGIEVADMLIANSIFFLNRWSTFGLGIIALLTADRLLFEDRHWSIILDTARIQVDDVAIFYGKDGNTELAQAIKNSASKGNWRIKQVSEDENLELPTASRIEAQDSEEFMLIDYGLASLDSEPEKEVPLETKMLDIGQVWTMEEETNSWYKQQL